MYTFRSWLSHTSKISARSAEHTQTYHVFIVTLAEMNALSHQPIYIHSHTNLYACTLTLADMHALSYQRICIYPHTNLYACTLTPTNMCMHCPDLSCRPSRLTAHHHSAITPQLTITQPSPLNHHPSTITQPSPPNHHPLTLTPHRRRLRQGRSGCRARA